MYELAGRLRSINPDTTIVRTLTPLLLLVVSLPALTLNLDVVPPPWWDEGVNTHTARTLAVRGLYGTCTSDGCFPFNPAVTTGPPVIIPIALIYKIIGAGMFQGRLVIVSFALLTILCLYGFAKTIHGRPVGTFMVLFFLMIPPVADVGFHLMGRQVLGEAPSLALILLGIWLWFRSWGESSWPLSLLGGLACGLGLIAKMQASFALIPTLALIGLLRGFRRKPMQLLQLMTPALGASLLAVGWILLQYLGAPEHVQPEGNSLSTEGVNLLLLTGFWRRSLSARAYVILAVMLLAVASTTWRLVGHRAEKLPATDGEWLEATLGLLVLCSALWFGFLSIGWPRYAYVGLMVGYFLLGRRAWDIYVSIRARLPALNASFIEHQYGAIVPMFALALLTNLLPIMSEPQSNWAERVADYVSQEIPRWAVIESWEWELDALSSHWKYHHPDQRYMLLSIHQYFLESGRFDLDYDLLQADPDFLITGSFSDWTGIYDLKSVNNGFVELKRIGPYRIFQRVRD